MGDIVTAITTKLLKESYTNFINIK